MFCFFSCVFLATCAVVLQPQAAVEIPTKVSNDTLFSKEENFSGRIKPLNIIIVSVPFSPMHSPVSIGQELCLRGHNVTVASFGVEGETKAKKYSSHCALRYISLGTNPLSSQEASETCMKHITTTNNTLIQANRAVKHVFSKFYGKLDGPFEKILFDKLISPDFAIITLPLGNIPHILRKHGIDFAINMPGNAAPPLVDHVAAWVPPSFITVTPERMNFLVRVIVLTLNSAVYGVKHFGTALRLIPESVGEFDISQTRGKLWLFNSVPGLDYPQPFPPLLQYTGCLSDIDKAEEFPAEVLSFLESVPADKPVVYISYGTFVALSRDVVHHIVDTLAEENLYVLWALPKPQQVGLPEQLPSNVLVHNWIPTTRALAHPKVRVFVSHCGVNSVLESLAQGVPIVGYPQLGDQLPLCSRVAYLGAGITAPKPQSWLRKEDILNVLENPSYTQHAEAFKRLFKLFGGVRRAADLVEAAALGDLSLLVTPRELSFSNWFFLGGYDLLIAAGVFCALMPKLLCSALNRCLGPHRSTARHVKEHAS